MLRGRTLDSGEKGGYEGEVPDQTPDLETGHSPGVKRNPTGTDGSDG